MGLCDDGDFDDSMASQLDYGWVVVVKLELPQLDPDPCMSVYNKVSFKQKIIIRLVYTCSYWYKEENIVWPKNCSYRPPELLPNIKGSHDLDYIESYRIPLHCGVAYKSVSSLGRAHVIRVCHNVSHGFLPTGKKSGQGKPGNFFISPKCWEKSRKFICNAGYREIKKMLCFSSEKYKDYRFML